MKKTKKRIKSWFGDRKATIKNWNWLIFPILMTVIVVWLEIKCKYQFLESANINNALGSYITFASITIGMINVLTTTTLNKAGKSSSVKKYMNDVSPEAFVLLVRLTLCLGVISAFLAIILYFRDILKSFIPFIFYTWIFAVISFLILVIRFSKVLLNLLMDAVDDESCDLQVEITNKPKYDRGLGSAIMVPPKGQSEDELGE